MAEPSYASASVRNSEPILGVLIDELGERERLLEIGSGTGYHAVRFGRALPQLTWQTSDLAENHGHIHAALSEHGLSNVLPPIALDVREQNENLEAASYDGVYSSNTAHIMAADAVRDMVALVGKALRPGGRFLLYGPFKRRGRFSTPSNASFDESLRARDSDMGIRDLEAIDQLALHHALHLARVYAMPANNLLVAWQKAEASS